MLRTIAPTVCLWLLAAVAHAGAMANVLLPEGWFALRPDEAGVVLMLRGYGGDTTFELVDEGAEVADTIVVPERRTMLAQYRVAPGSYRLRFFDKDMQVKATAGFFVAFGGAVTHVPATADKPAAVVPDHAPVANYTPIAMAERVIPLVEFGGTDFLPPKTLEAKTLELRVAESTK